MDKAELALNHLKAAEKHITQAQKALLDAVLDGNGYAGTLSEARGMCTAASMAISYAAGATESVIRIQRQDGR